MEFTCSAAVCHIVGYSIPPRGVALSRMSFIDRRTSKFYMFYADETNIQFKVYSMIRWMRIG
jgi:hypothetical protein